MPDIVDLKPSAPRASTFTPASVILQRMHDEAPADHVTVGWLIDGHGNHSFGLILLLLAIAAIAPGLCLIAGPLLTVPAFQMIAGKPAPTFPRWITKRTFPARQLEALLRRAIPVLRYFEKSVHPRWRIPPEAAKRIAGIAIMILSLRLTLTPIPLSNIMPALVMALIALAYLEDDGLTLSIGLLAAFVLLAVDFAVVLEVVRGAKWISRLAVAPQIFGISSTA